MTSNEILHIAARRYLMDRHKDVKALSDEIRRWGVQADELLLHPRMALLSAMLAAVEALVPTTEPQTNFRTRVAEAGRTAENDVTLGQSWREQGIWETTWGERKAFVEAVLSWTELELSGLSPLPFRRAVLTEERAALWTSLCGRWKVGGRYWFPWSDTQLDEEVVVVDAAALRDNIGMEALRSILSENGVSRVYELWQYNEEQDYELKLEQFDVGNGWGERFWFSHAMDWIIYVTHEGSAAVAGEWLLARMKVVWPTWAEHPYVPFRPVVALPKPSQEDRLPGLGPGHLELLAASWSGKLDKVAALLDAGVDVNGRAPKSGTVLHTAAARGQLGSVRLLIERGADVEARTVSGVTPLMEAVSSGHVEVVRLLLTEGSDVRIRAGVSEHDRRTRLTALEIAESSPYLAALGDGRQAAIITLLRHAGERKRQ